MTFPIIDSHIHLFTADDLPRLAWAGDLPKDHELNGGNTVNDYKAATSPNKSFRGFVFLETDRKSGLQEHEWDDVINEVQYLARIALGKPGPDDGHQPEDSKLLLGVVPWAPLPAGPTVLAKYVQRALQVFPDDQRGLVKGFRYLLQDKPRNTMLQPAFIESLCWLGDNNFSFDLGVDARSAGLHQLEEACNLCERISSTGNTLTIIINHFAKPNLRLSRPEAVSGHPDFTGWKACIEKMASFDFTYMKLSGFFSELPAQTEAEPEDVSILVSHMQPWIDVVFKAFTPSRILFGSDWPVLNVGGPGRQLSWHHWCDLVTTILESQELSEDEKAMIWAGTAAKAYKISLA